MSEKKVSIIYSLKDKASKGFKSILNSVRNLKKNLLSLNGILTGITFGAITSAAIKAAKIFGFQEEAIKSLNTALKNNNLYTKNVSESLQIYASKLQKTTTFGDEQLIQAEALFAQFGFNEQAIKKLTKATTDLAVAKGIDLRQAADLLAKSVGSTTNALSRYGITISGLPKSSQRVDSAVRSLSNLFGGQATAQAKTFNGSLQQMKNAVGDVVEIIGKHLVPIILKGSNKIKIFAESLQEKKLKNIKDGFLKINESIKPLYKTIDLLSKTIIKSIKGLFLLKNSIKESYGYLGQKFKNLFSQSFEEKTLKQHEKLLKKLEKLKKYKSQNLKSENKKDANSASKETKLNGNSQNNFLDKLEQKQKNFDIELNLELQNKKKLLQEQKKFLKAQIKNEILTHKQKKTLDKNLNNFRKNLLEENYSNHEKKAEQLTELTNNLNTFEIKSSKDVAKASIQILKNSLNVQINSIIKTGILRALSKANYPLVGAIIAAGAAAKIAINSMKFNKGGIVPGNAFSGDKIMGRLNSGEMVLNRSQQASLFNLIKNNVIAKKMDNNYLYDSDTDYFDREKKTNKEIVILTDDGRELAKGISYMQSEMKKNGEII